MRKEAAMRAARSPRWWAALAVAVMLVTVAPDSGASGAPRHCPSGHVAVTFDDGPHPVYTPQVLDILAARKVQATFFVSGQLVSLRPHIVARTAADGHVIANHTWAHEQLTGLSDAAVAATIERANQAIAQTTGRRPYIFRPPYGATNQRVNAIAARMGLPSILWDIDTRDWAGRGPSLIAATVQAGLRDGAIILVHDGVGRSFDTVAALPQIIDEAHARGFCFGVLDERGGVVPFSRREVRYRTVRIAGPDRLATAVAVSRTGWPGGAGSVVLASSEDWPDALTATALAGAAGGPLLLSRDHSVPAAVLEELQRLRPHTVHVIGRLQPAVEHQLAVEGLHAVRLAGTHRYATSGEVARATVALGTSPDRVVVVSGEGYADALAAGPLAVGGRMPILLVGSDGGPRLAQQVAALGAQEVWVVGGQGAVPDSVLHGLPSVHRIAGPDRASTSAGAATWGRGLGLDGWPTLVSGDSYADGLSAGVLAGAAARGPLLLSSPGHLAPPTAA
jgi:peptidoglycan-N-acetylglucosamine deacetylase